MSALRLGIMDPLIAARPFADTFTRASYLGAVAARVDSFWVPDHLNALFPRSLWTPKYSDAAKIVPMADAVLEPWTMLGHIAARNRLRRMHLGIGVTDTGRRNPAVTEIVKMPNRGHALTIDHGWHEVADTALQFVQRFLPAPSAP